jgi:uncharacterized membrane protein YuzA (DUF378 family)
MMHRIYPAGIVMVVLTILSWVLIGLLIFALVRALVTGNGWMYLD